MFVKVEHQQLAPKRPYINQRGEIRNEKQLYISELIRRLLLTIIIANLEQFVFKNKAIIYTEVFIKLYNQKNHNQFYKIEKIIEIQKMRVLIPKNPYKSYVCWIIESIISFIQYLYSF